MASGSQQRRQGESRAAELMAHFKGEAHKESSSLTSPSSEASRLNSSSSSSSQQRSKTKEQPRNPLPKYLLQDTDSEDDDDSHRETMYLTEDGLHVIEKKNQVVNGHAALIAYERNLRDVDAHTLARLCEKRDRKLARRREKEGVKYDDDEASKSAKAEGEEPEIRSEHLQQRLEIARSNQARKAASSRPGSSSSSFSSHGQAPSLSTVSANTAKFKPRPGQSRRHPAGSNSKSSSSSRSSSTSSSTRTTKTKTTTPSSTTTTATAISNSSSLPTRLKRENVMPLPPKQETKAAPEPEAAEEALPVPEQQQQQQHTLRRSKKGVSVSRMTGE